MEKLRNLLAQYMGLVYCDFRLEDREPEITSKKFGFIHRLVDNDKTDFEEYAEEWRDSNINNNADFFQLYKRYDMYESLLMLLSIQDEPIEFLISILK